MGRPKGTRTLSETLNVRLSPEMKGELDRIAEYEQMPSRISEVVRGWVRNKIHDYESNPRFKQYWREKEAKSRREEAKKEVLGAAKPLP